MWNKYDVELNMTGIFAASLPKTREEIQKMLEHRMPLHPPVNFVPVPELTDIVAEEVNAPEEGTEEQQFGWATFCRNDQGLYYEGRCIRGHLKDCANQVRDSIKPEIKALKAHRGLVSGRQENQPFPR